MQATKHGSKGSILALKHRTDVTRSLKHFVLQRLLKYHLCNMGYLHLPTLIPVPRQNELRSMIMFGCDSTDLERDLGQDRWVLYALNTDLGAIPLTSIVTFSVKLLVSPLALKLEPSNVNTE